jgi:VWFA-related protein
MGKVKERSAGKFELKGKFSSTDKSNKDNNNGEEPDPETSEETSPAESGPETKDAKKQKKAKPQSRAVSLRFTTARGIVLLNVPPNEVMSDLRERPLTDAAKAIIRSGDTVLTDAIRRASPKYFGDYMRTLPPARLAPDLTSGTRFPEEKVETVKRATVRVTDNFNRAIDGLSAADFEVTESGEPREILSIQPVTAPVNLVLLLDVSGSVDNYVNFIRKAARSFVDTVNGNDRISLVVFNDDVKVLSGFSTDRARLSSTLDTFDAGGGTAYYDAVAYTLAESLRPLRGERTAIVILTDGDDNRSFLPFDALTGAIEESGALIYPLYVPSALVAAASANPDATVDPVRSRYTGLSQKAVGEGEKLAKISGGVYYPISQVSDIQKAYDDIVRQIRTAYSVTFRSGTAADPQNRPSPRLRIKSKRPGTFVTINQVAPATGIK